MTPPLATIGVAGGLLGLIGVLGAFWATGWVRLRRSYPSLARGPVFLAGLGALLVIGAVEVLTVTPWDHRFAVRMAQHQALLLVAAPLLVLARPIPFLLWGLPPRVRRRLGSGLRRGSPLRRALRPFGRAHPVALLFLVGLWSWHLPPVQAAARAWPPLHGVEHLAFLGLGLLIWWRALAAPPYWAPRLSLQARIGVALGAYVANQVLGIALILTRVPLFNSLGLWDQSLGGAVMWVPGEITYATLTMLLLARLLAPRKGAEPFRGVSNIYDFDYEDVLDRDRL